MVAKAEKRILTPGEIYELYNVQAPTIRKWVREGRIAGTTRKPFQVDHRSFLQYWLKDANPEMKKLYSHILDAA